MHKMPPRKTPGQVLQEALTEFGDEYQITAEDFVYVAVRRPKPSVQEVVVGHDPAELIAKLRADRDGTDAS